MTLRQPFKTVQYLEGLLYMKFALNMGLLAKPSNRSNPSETKPKPLPSPPVQHVLISYSEQLERVTVMCLPCLSSALECGASYLDVELAAAGLHWNTANILQQKITTIDALYVLLAVVLVRSSLQWGELPATS